MAQEQPRPPVGQESGVLVHTSANRRWLRSTTAGVDTADTSGPPVAPARTIAYCSWHKGYSETCRLVRHEDAGIMGPPGLFACVDCRHAHQLLPVADRP